MIFIIRNGGSEPLLRLIMLQSRVFLLGHTVFMGNNVFTNDWAVFLTIIVALSDKEWL